MQIKWTSLCEQREQIILSTMSLHQDKVTKSRSLFLKRFSRYNWVILFYQICWRVSGCSLTMVHDVSGYDREVTFNVHIASLSIWGFVHQGPPGSPTLAAPQHIIPLRLFRVGGGPTRGWSHVPSSTVPDWAPWVEVQPTGLRPVTLSWAGWCYTHRGLLNPSLGHTNPSPMLK